MRGVRYGTALARTQRGKFLSPGSIVICNNGCFRKFSDESVKPRLWTLKDARTRSPRHAKPANVEYLSKRQAAFAAEEEKAKALGMNWGIRSALVLERLQVVIPEPEDWERDFMEIQEKEQSLDTSETILPKKMEAKETPKSYPPRWTPADEENDRTSLERALEARLVLIIKRTPDGPWHLPETLWKTGETIRRTAERVSRQILANTATVATESDITQIYFVGNCPAGWFWRTADDQQLQKETGIYGDKVFINRAQYIKGKVTFTGKVAEYLWVTKDEIGDYLGDSLGLYLKHML